MRTRNPKKPLMTVETVMDCGDGTYWQVTMPIHDKEVADSIRSETRYQHDVGYSAQASVSDVLPRLRCDEPKSMVHFDLIDIHGRTLRQGYDTIDESMLVTDVMKDDHRPSLKSLITRDMIDTLHNQMMASCTSRRVVSACTAWRLKPFTHRDGTTEMRLKLPRKLKKRILNGGGRRRGIC